MIKRHVSETLFLFALVFNNMLGAGMLFVSSGTFAPNHLLLWGGGIAVIIVYIYARTVIRLYDKSFIKHGFTSLIGSFFGPYIGYVTTLGYIFIIVIGILSLLNVGATTLSYAFPDLSNLEYRFLFALIVMIGVVLILLSYKIVAWVLVILACIKILWLLFFGFGAIGVVKLENVPVIISVHTHYLKYTIFWLIWSFIGIESVLWFSHFRIHKTEVRLIVWGNCILMSLLLLLTYVFLLIGLHFHNYPYELIGYVDGAKNLFGNWAWMPFLIFVVLFVFGSLVSWTYTLVIVISKTIKIWHPMWPLYNYVVILITGLALVSFFGLYNVMLSLKMDLILWKEQLMAWLIMILVYRVMITKKMLFIVMVFVMLLILGYYMLWGLPHVSLLMLCMSVIPIFFVLHAKHIINRR